MESSLDSLLTNADDDDDNGTQFFFPEWVTEVFYGWTWYPVKPGTYKEGIKTKYGTMAVYLDAFNGQMVFVTEPITGYKVEKPKPIEPEAEIIAMRSRQK